MNKNLLQRLFSEKSNFAYLLVAFYFVFKILHLLFFDYSLDIYSCLQLSRDWLYSKPLMYENLFGPFANQHNAFIVLLFFPLTVFVGCYGFFIVQFFAWIYAIYSILELLKDRSEIFKILVLFVLILGPVGYYQYDDPLYGFNPELLFVPFVINLASAVIGQKNAQLILWYVLISLIREDGIILAACVHVMIHYLNPVNDKNAFQSIWSNRKIVLIGLLVFAIGILRMFLLKQNSSSRMACIQYNISMVNIRQLLDYYIPDISKAILLMLSGFVILYIVLPVKKKIFGVLLFLSPMVLSNMIASIFNFSHETGSCFAPRVSYVYGALLASIIAALYYTEPKLNKNFVIALSLILIIGQYVSLRYVRDYDYFQNSFGLLTGNHKTEAEQNKIAQMKKISSKLGQGFPVESPWKYFKAFDKQDICFPGRSYNAFIKPLLIIEEKNNPLEIASPPTSTMNRYENARFIFYYEKDLLTEEVFK